MYVSRTFFVLILLASVFISPFVYLYHKLVNYQPGIPVLEETWWTDENPEKEDKNIYPFKINITQEILNDLKSRLDNTRPFTKPLQDNHVNGFNSDLAQEILDYWRTKYDWKKREDNLNKYPHFITSIQGLKIHFIHLKPQNISDRLKILPLLLCHGWPSSFIEFLNVITMLTKPQENRNFVFEVVVPSLPGFGFSQAPQKPGLGATETALILKNLMNRLGHRRFYVHGGDLGMMVLKVMSMSLEDSVLGFHNHMCVSLHPYSLFKLVMGSFNPDWIRRKTHRELFYPISRLIQSILMESGYLHTQSTKPDTYGVGIDDSPMGMAVLFLEKYSTGASLQNRFRKDGGLKEKYNYDDLLDNIMIYWVTKTGTTSNRFYAASFRSSSIYSILVSPVKVPSACTRGNYDIISPEGIVEETFPNIVHSVDYDVGHFFGFENPKLLASDIYEAINKMELNSATRKHTDL
ncbi:juvenile hormone epoxide hydrolase 1-like [Harmonia axyridis]|uniref:juvenile hormone epoxide hydrolase 1-like n=1 Tax=Harmonia axyridis TaxID=115357 RepID=UPI001E27665F|nr:juvenile hormone epoxide hydrolase 1-like [Harmonia axyridis]